LVVADYVLGASLFLFVVGGGYFKYLNYQQEKEADRLGVRVLSRLKWTHIDDNDPRCTPELGHAYRLTNLLFIVNFTTSAALFVLATKIGW
jgi:hypothetical protein